MELSSLEIRNSPSVDSELNLEDVVESTAPRTYYSTPSGIFREFASATMLRMLFHDRITTKDNMVPIATTHYAAVLFADISGFTRLSASLNVDDLRRRINNYFSNILGVIQEHNGDVVKFCGDAILVIWPVDKLAEESVRRVTVQMATGCALHLLHDSQVWNKELETPKTPMRGKETEHIGLHCGVSSGSLHCTCLGEADRWEFLVSGEVINHVGLACSEAADGELCLSAEAYKLINDRMDGAPTPKGCYKLGASDRVFKHIPRSNLANKLGDEKQLKRTWSSYPELDQPSSSAEMRDRTPVNINIEMDVAKASLPPPNAGLSSDLDDSSSILTFGSSPTKGTGGQRTPLKNAFRASKLDSVPDEIPGSHYKSVSKSIKTLTTLKKTFASALSISENELSRQEQKARALSNASTTTNLLVTLPSDWSSAQSSIPRFLSLDDLKAQRQLSAGDMSSEGVTPPSKPVDLSTDDDSRDRASLSLGSPLAVRRGATNLKLDTKSPLVSKNVDTSAISPMSQKSVKSPTSSSSSRRVFDALANFTSKQQYDDHCEDERLFINVDEDLSDQCESSIDTNTFQEPENEEVRVVKNYLSGYLKTEDSPSLYEFDGMSQVLRCFVQESARKSVEKGTTSFLAELRVVVTIFIEIIGLGKDFTSGNEEKLIKRPQKVLRFMLACLKHFGGSLRQYIVDDKGCVMIAGFGLPGYSHVDNCARAVETAVAMRRLIQASHLECKIGIAEGRVYCGLVGSSERCEYAMMGASVNLAARMMGKCKAGQITVNEEVYHRTVDNFVYNILPKIRAKGYRSLIAVYSPLDRIQMLDIAGTGDGEEGPTTRKVEEFIGREHELKIFESALNVFCNINPRALEKNETPFMYLIEGDIGVGKTWLVGEVCYLASQHMDIENIIVVTAENQSPQSYAHSQYDTIRQLLIQIFGITTSANSFTPDVGGKNRQIDEGNVPLLSPRHWAETPTGSESKSHKDSPMHEKGHFFAEPGPREGLMKKLKDSNGSVFSSGPDVTQASSSSTDPADGIRRSVADNITHPTSFTPESRIRDWVEKNVGADDVLTARTSVVESSPGTPGNMAWSGTAMGSHPQHTSSYESGRTTKSEDMSHTEFTSGSLSEQSEDIALPRHGKTVTKKVLEMLPLLNKLLSANLPMTEEVKQLSKEDCSIMLNVLLIFIVTRTMEKSRTLLVVEHLQWCDHHSLYIILQSLKIAKSDVFFIGTLRSTSGIKHKYEMSSRRSKVLAELLYCCSHIVLYPFVLDEVKSTLESALGPVLNLANPDIMSNHNLSVILDRTDGSPLLVCYLCYEIASAIKSGTFVDIESLPCGRRDNLIDLFDLLGHSDQLILKVASVIGRTFTFQELCYLLVMMGLSACLVDLDAALNRMIETSFIEEYHVESGVQIETSTSPESKGNTSVAQHLLRYRFTNNSVHENVYNLMLEEHREVAHTFLGAYLEPYLSQKPALFDRAVFHFIRSGNASKKIEYLCKAAEVSRIAGNFRDVYFYFGELVKLSTGLKVQDLLAYCCISPEQPSTAEENEGKSFVLCRVPAARYTVDFPVFVCLGRRWLSGSDFKNGVYSLLSEISIENVCRWIGEMGLILFKLGSLQASANLIKLALYGMNLPVAFHPDVSRRTIGVVSNMFSQAKTAYPTSPNRQTRDDSVTEKKEGKRLWRTISSALHLNRSAKQRSIEDGDLPENLTTLRLAMSLFEHLCMLNLMHGVTGTTLQYITYCADIKAKISHILSDPTAYRNGLGVVSFIDRIIEPEDPQLQEDPRNQAKASLSGIGMSLKNITSRAIGSKLTDAVDVGFAASLADNLFLKANEEEDHTDNLLTPGSTGEEKSNSIYSLSSVSYEQTPTATPDNSSKYSTPNTNKSTPPNFKDKHMSRNGKQSQLAFEQAVCLFDKAMENASVANFQDCFLCLRRGAVLLGALGEEVGGTTRQFVYLYQSWCCFINGRSSKSKILLEVVSKFVSIFEQATLCKWALELKVLRTAFSCYGLSNVASIEDIVKQMRDLQKCDRPSSCASAVLAFCHALDGDPLTAVVNAKFAIYKLVQRDAVTFIGPLFLFLAGYSAAIAMELYVLAMIGATEKVAGSDRSLDARKASSGDLTDAESRGIYDHVEWKDDAKARTYTALRRYEQAEECLQLTLDRLKSIYKTSQPCLVVTYRALKIKHAICTAVLKGTVSKLPLAKLLSTQKTEAFTEFAFGNAFLLLERLNLKVLSQKNSVKEAAPKRETEAREVMRIFNSLGCSSNSKLERMGLLRFYSEGKDSMGLQSANSLSTSFSEMSMRQGSSTYFDNTPEELQRISRIVTTYRSVDTEDVQFQEADDRNK